MPTPEEQKIIDDKAAADKKAAESAEDPAKTLADIKAFADELGITPGQLKGRLEASKTWEQRAKQVTPEELVSLRDAASRLKTIEDSTKSDTDKLLERIAAAEKAAADTGEKLTASEQRALRSEVALAKGVPVALITGVTQEEMEASADTLIAYKGKPIIPDTGGGNRGDNIGGGEQMTQADVDKLTAEKKFDEIVTAQAAGRLNNLLGIKS